MRTPGRNTQAGQGMTKKIRNVLRGKAHEYKAMVAMIAPGDDVNMRGNEAGGISPLAPREETFSRL